MDGYLKPKFKATRKELRVLELDDCEFISDDEDKMQSLRGRKHICKRCGGVTYYQTADPYCSHCNWDSLTDLISSEAL